MMNILKLAESLSNQTKLKAMGWSDFFQEKVSGADIPARVVSVNKDIFLVSQGVDDAQVRLSGKVRHKSGTDSENLFPVIGDWVLLRDAVIDKVLPRRNALSRGAAGGRGKSHGAAMKEQVMAANLDTVFIVCGLDRDYNVRRIERYLTLVYNCNLSPVVVLTKADLHEDPLECVDEVESVAFGVPVHLVSADDESGVLELEQYLSSGKTATMIGSSGAGKSTLLNRLYGNSVQQTGAVSQSVGKGRHTTTGRDMIAMPQGGSLIDNPGIREIAFYSEDGGVESSFADIEDYARYCRFSDCDHLNDPGCNVLQAVENGDLSTERLESYRKMKRELDYISQRQHKTADRIEKERWRDVAMKIKVVNKNWKRR
ncbi:ribosome small subunit-dependent GTPase A [Maridesulfovibrio salexigens]|uniref:Small ribosomal subunit biogenesis GTPase RsgA n=1 Tax=Maridesulfovibrio salexigens (strain ATCC 14822 / DSM 2638 / NCIMB 8403 / VKM B-1763) TaxID=526222 RepID=C6BVN5_MARSD|nr:ribosome small subunit-dependent GTPase A [Maridesulfovibrio salexigens]ACS78249.1 ribosome small subunit-dependent GTPase A [Maridesulfovibrio salexigens DSM 2638]